MDGPVMTFKSHIQGKNSDVAVYEDRVEWAQEGRLTLTRLTGKAVTRGKLSARKAGESEVIPIKAMTSVTIQRDGFRQIVKVICSGNTIEFRVGRGEAEGIKTVLTDLMLGKHPSQAAPGSAANSRQEQSPGSTSGSSLADELAKLASLRDAGVLSDEEFAAQKAKLLG
jgi:hypothetical protein